MATRNHIMGKQNMKSLKNYKSILRLTLTHLKNLFFDFKKLILLFFVILFLMFSFHQYMSDAKKPVIAIVTDDDSFQMKMVIQNLKDSNVKKALTVEQRKKHDIKDAVFLVEIEDDAIHKMETNPPIDVTLSYNKNEPVSALIKSYVDDVVFFINSTQKSAMLYWDKLKKEGVGFDDRFSKLNELSLYVISSFTSRDDFAVHKSQSESLVTTFFLLIILVVAMFINNDMISDIKSGIYQRLKINGFTSIDYILSRLILSTLISGVVIGIVIYIYYALLGDVKINIFEMVLFTLLINMLSILIYYTDQYIYLVSFIVLIALFSCSTYVFLLVSFAVQLFVINKDKIVSVLAPSFAKREV